MNERILFEEERLKYMKEMKIGTYIYNDESYTFEFYTNLTASEKITFINSIVDTIIDDNYNYIVKDIMFNHMIIQLFTNVGNFYTQNVKNKIDAIEQFLDETNIVDIVKVNMELGLLEELKKSVDLAIEYRTGIHPSPLNEALAGLISTLEKKINEVDLNSMMGMASKVAEMGDGFTIDNLVNAYINSDTHKNNLIEIEEAKKQRAEIAENLDKAINSVDGVKETKLNAKSKK